MYLNIWEHFKMQLMCTDNSPYILISSSDLAVLKDGASLDTSQPYRPSEFRSVEDKNT